MTTRQTITDFIQKWIVRMCDSCGTTTIDELVELGFCADLADNIHRLFPEVAFHSTGNKPKSPVHTWVSFEGIHFDMQNPNGVDDWKKLDYFKDTPNAQLDDE